MKTPKSSKLLSEIKSDSDVRLKRRTPTAASHRFKSGDKMKNLKCLPPKFHNHKSETSIAKCKFVLGNPLLHNTASNPQLIPTPKTPKQPKETLRRSLSKLKSSQWNQYVSALQDVVQISRYNPQLLHKAMPDIYKGIIKLLRSLRISAVRTACQAANELFMNIQYGEAPEFDELVHALLQKAADPNKQLEKDALEALNSMIIHMSPNKSIKALLHRRIAGCNLKVRTTASKLLACALDDSDAHPVTSLKEDVKVRLMFAAKRFMRDDSNDIRYYGKRLLSKLLKHEDFRLIYEEKITVESLYREGKIT